jgi:hypothetical protein
MCGPDTSGARSIRRARRCMCSPSATGRPPILRRTVRRSRSVTACRAADQRNPDALVAQVAPAVWLAGQIPLVPATLALVRPRKHGADDDDGPSTWALAVRHAWTVLRCMGPTPDRLVVGLAALEGPAAPLAAYRRWWDAVWATIAPVRRWCFFFMRTCVHIVTDGPPGPPRPRRRRGWWWLRWTPCRAAPMSRLRGSLRDPHMVGACLRWPRPWPLRVRAARWWVCRACTMQPPPTTPLCHMPSWTPSWQLQHHQPSHSCKCGCMCRRPGTLPRDYGPQQRRRVVCRWRWCRCAHSSRACGSRGWHGASARFQRKPTSVTYT